MEAPDFPFEQLSVDGAEVFVMKSPCALARLELPWDLHVRPATHLFKALSQKPYFSRLRLCSEDKLEWSDFQILSLLAQGLARGTPIQIQVSGPDSGQAIREVLDVIRDCPVYREYVPSAPAGNGNGEILIGGPSPEDLAEFDQEFEQRAQGYALIRINLENFILANNLLIEGQLHREGRCATVVEEKEITRLLRQLLIARGRRGGMLFTGTAFDNLLQIRDMCRSEHFDSVHRHLAIPYREVEIRWAGQQGHRWRHRQQLRLLHFFNKEQDFYRELFLLTLMHEWGRLGEFLEAFARRMDFSLTLRRNINAELKRFQTELSGFRRHFQEPDQFTNCVNETCRAIAREVARFTPYMRMIRDRTLCLPERRREMRPQQKG